MQRSLIALAAVVLVGLGACRRETPDQRPAPTAARTPPSRDATAPVGAPTAAKPDPDGLPEARGLPPERRALQVVAGAERTVDADLARERGLTLVDLSDGWAPALFDDGTAADGSVLPNRYRAIFVGLANDRLDGDGHPLAAGEKNYLDLFGVPPSLSVLRERFLADAARTCDREIDGAKLLAVSSIPTWGSTSEGQELRKHEQRGARLEAARARLGAATLEALAEAEPRHARELKIHRRFEAERAAFAEIEKRLTCEALMDPARHKPGRYDSPMRKAVLAFQHKHALLDLQDIHRSTLQALARPLLENDFASLRRALTERAVHAGGIIEDGSVQPPDWVKPRSADEAAARAGDDAAADRPGKPKRRPVTYKSRDGSRIAVPDLETEVTDALMARLGLATPDDAAAFFRRHRPEDFRSMRAAVRFPPPPEYHGAQMELYAEIDRGDVWYDFPFDESGVRQPQHRSKFPAFTLFVKWQGEKVPLVRWRTTIGGWRSELAADGEEYYRFKISDVGARVWRHIVAAPVWIPPRSSPLGGMVKEKRVNGAFVRVTNYDETGPGYLSAYGLAAAIHEKMSRRGDEVRFFDNGIRTHGSFDYMSLRGRFSHGCHRLYNNLAVRLFTFVIKHRKVKAVGPVTLGFRQFFWWGGEVFDMRLPTRGFYYELDPPMPVETLEGNIKGKVKNPVTQYVRKPGVQYASERPPPAPNSPEAKAGGTGGAP